MSHPANSLPLNELQSEVHLSLPSIEVRAITLDSQLVGGPKAQTAEDKKEKNHENKSWSTENKDVAGDSAYEPALCWHDIRAK